MLTQIKSFGDNGEQKCESDVASLNSALASCALTYTTHDLYCIVLAMLKNHRIPVASVRNFIHSLNEAVFGHRGLGRRSLVYEAILHRSAVVPDILQVSPSRVLISGDSNGMTPFHYACKHGSPQDIESVGNMTPHAALDKVSRLSRTPIVEAILSLRGASVVEAVMPFTSHDNVWHKKDTSGLCAIHVAVCSNDDFSTNRILDRVVSMRDFIDRITGRSIINVAMDTDMPMHSIVSLVGHLHRKCPDILADLMNESSIRLTDPIDIFLRTMHCRPVADALLAAIPPSRMHETLTRRRGLCSSTVFHFAADYPYSFVQLVGHGSRCGIPAHEMLSAEGHMSGTPMHAVAEGSFTNFNYIVSDLNLYCDITCIIRAMFAFRTFDRIFAFECLRNLRDFEHFIKLTVTKSPAMLHAIAHRQAIIRHAVRLGSCDVINGKAFTVQGEEAITNAAAEVTSYIQQDDTLLGIAAQAYSATNERSCNIILTILSRTNPRHVTPATERALLLACSQNIFTDIHSIDLKYTDSASCAMHYMRTSVRSIKRWRIMRTFIRTRWLVNWWVERATQSRYAPGGSVYESTKKTAMAVFA